MRQAMKVDRSLNDDELKLVLNYIDTGGLKVSAARATLIAYDHNIERLPRPGYELVLEVTDHQHTILKNKDGGYVLHIWTSPNAPWLIK